MTTMASPTPAVPETATQTAGKIRLIGLPDEVVAIAERLDQVLDIVEISEPKPCRGNSRQVRLYLDVRL
jgi:hypothetical protein